MRMFSVCLMVLVGWQGTSALAQEMLPKDVLQMDAGTWDAKVTMHGMGQEMVSEGTEENKMLGQVWLVSSFKGEFGGEVFEGRGHVGYDPASKQYVGSWIDSMTPVATQMKGTYDPKTKTMTLQTKGVDMQGKPSTGTVTTVYQGTDKRTTTMHSMIDGKKVKVMEIVYQRAAGK
ncbi:DUF1579 family protein [Rhodopirellula sp. P2]|uniref:DUF1579 family protein n=1 Tax=Rhodopirellula sp. P2 TaxID=2127060 RepID=UPI002367C5F1|nr:DUF1579 family protein [Rhodopirellula sp. P2]WDQ17907.1 DUF1579 family protein [Rhodopirellula sp. P2]